MSCVDAVLSFDNRFILTNIVIYTDLNEWIRQENAEALKGKTLEQIFGSQMTSKPTCGILEIGSSDFSYRMVENQEGYQLFLSKDGALLELYEQALDKVSEGIQIYDRSGYFLYGNKASETLEQYSRETFRGKHIIDLYDLKEEFSTVLTVLRTQAPVLNRCDRFRVKEGKTLTTINSGYPLMKGSTLKGAVVSESDLSVLLHIRNRLSSLETFSENKVSEPRKNHYSFEDIVHQSESMKEVIHFSKKIALTDSNVLITGETGTGKELFAQSIHTFSPRRNKPFIDVNCSAIPSNLMESLFFGTERGAYTGSLFSKGYFEQADGGTLFLDEVNSIPLDVQAKLLRVLQDKRVQRIGGSKYHQCDVRIISATNEDLSRLVGESRIRKDFYYRISTIKIDIPGLEARREDIILLAEFFLKDLCEKYNKLPLSLSPEVCQILTNSPWPGHVRELQHAIEYAFNCISEPEKIILQKHLPEHIRQLSSTTHRVDTPLQRQVVQIDPFKSLNDQLEDFERLLITSTLETFEGNITKAAKSLGMSRQNFQYRLKKFSESFQ